MDSLKGKTAVVTGATSGIGLSIANMLIAEGVFTFLIGRNFKMVSKLFQENNFSTNTYKFIKVDLANDQDLLNLEIQIDNKEIDILIHCAGVISLGEFEKLSAEDLDHQYQINLRAPFVVTKRLLPKIRKTKGDIVFINSTTGLSAWENVSQYAATKHALRAMTDSLRKEVAKDQVRIASLYLGSVDTPMQESIHLKKRDSIYDSSKFMQPTDIAEAVLNVLSISKRATITDLTIRQNF